VGGRSWPSLLKENACRRYRMLLCAHNNEVGGIRKALGVANLRYDCLTWFCYPELGYPGAHFTFRSSSILFLLRVSNSAAHAWWPAFTIMLQQRTKRPTPWPESASELYRPSDRRLSAKLVLTIADRGVSRSQCSGSPTAVISFL
jgi:hypothetical protein